MQINGGRLAGIQEVMLSANEELGTFPGEQFERFGDDKNTGPPRPRIGDVLSIHLSQDSRSTAVWTITVFVQIAQGWFILGMPIITNPPTGLTPDPPARTIGFASCPGTIGWKVICECPDEDEIADLVLQSRQGGGGSGSNFGVTPNPFVPPG